MPRPTFKCPSCRATLPPAFLRSAVGKLNNAKRTPGGKAKVRKPCPHCKKRKWGARELRDHIPRCLKNPKKREAIGEVLPC